MIETVDFYGGPFSNFAHSPFVASDRWGRLHRYETVEHYFQAAKTITEKDHDYVIDTKKGGVGPGEAKTRGQKIKLRDDWEDVKYEVMLEGLRYKFALDPFKTQLLETGHKELREDSPTDFIWGYRNSGLNLLGKALMQVRKEIRVEEFAKTA